MEDFTKYFTASDRFLLLGSEKIYLQFFIDEIGQLPIDQQVSYLISNLTDPSTNFPYLCSIYYLMASHRSTVDGTSKQVVISLRPSVISSQLSMAVIDHCFDMLTVEVPKEEEMIHFRIKVMLDLAVTLICGHYEDLQYQMPMYPGLLTKGVALCFKSIRLSQERMDIDLRRLSCLLLLLLKIKFRDRLIEDEINSHEHMENEEKVEIFEKMKKLVDMEEDGNGAEAIKGLVNQCHYFDVEAWFHSIITESSNPLPTVLVVGYLRALLNLVTTTRAKNTNGNYGFDCSSELESTYNYMTVYMSDLESTESLYKSKVEGNTSLQVKSYLFYTMAFDKIETLPEINGLFLEMKLLNLYKDLYSKDRDILPDSLAKELEEAKEGPTANVDNAAAAGLLINEIYSHRISTIGFITRTLSLVHRVLKSNNFFQALSLGNYIYDAKGILVMLKIISEKILQHEGSLNINTFEIDGFGPHRDDSCQNPIEGIVEDILYLFYHITFDYPELINSSLNEYKAHYALKKYPKMFPQNKAICNYTYMIIKKQMDLMPKKVKGNTANMAIVSHNYNAVVDMNAPSPASASFVHGIDGPARSVASVAESSSFRSVSSMNTVKHFLASTLHDVADRYDTTRKFDYTHEAAKKLCSAMNHMYNKHKDSLADVLKAKQDILRYKSKPQSVRQLYNEMYSKVEIPANFELFYEKWLDQEVYGYLD